jgi:hypothetical protein
MREAVGYLLQPPGWRPDGLGETTEDMRRRHAIATHGPREEPSGLGGLQIAPETR